MKIEQVEFDLNGYIVIKNVLSKGEIKTIIPKIDNAFVDPKMIVSSPKGVIRNGVVRNREIWNIIYHPKILKNIKNILGKEIKFLQHNSILKGFSASGWHRDSVDKSYNTGNDWSLTEPYRLLRVGLYLEDTKYSKFRLGFIKKSHAKKISILEKDNKFSNLIKAIEKRVAKLFNVNYYFPFLGNCQYLNIERGDMVIFDPRTFHRGTASINSKHAIIFAYGIENSHFKRHFQYFFEELPGYSKLPKLLEKELAQRNLLADINKS